MAATMPSGRQRFPIALDRLWRPYLLLWGVTPSRAVVDLDDTKVDARFGWSRITADLADIEGYTITGPYTWWAAIGIRRSVRNHDASFCGTARGGVCLRFRTGPRWLGFLHPPALTVSVADIDGFVRALEARGVTGDDRRKR